MKTAGRVLIIGAGPCGLGAAWRLKELGHEDFLVLEASDRVGGLASSRVDPQGFLWDEGGHVEYSHYPYFDSVMEAALRPGDWLSHTRSAAVRVGDSWVPYPFQNNIHRLPPVELDACLRGLEGREGGDPAPRDFPGWARRTFGDGIAELFMLPYNRKIWACPLELLGAQWVGERVSVPEPSRIRDNAGRGVDDVSWGGNRCFRFPKRGGTGAIWEAVASLAANGRLRLDSPVLGVDLRRSEVRLDGGAERFDLLLSTMPLDALSSLAEGLDEETRALARRLRRASTHVVGIGVEGALPAELKSLYWVYFPEADVPFYRVEVYSNFSPYNVPKPGRQWSLLAEVSEPPGSALEPGPLVERVLEGLRGLGWLGSGQSVASRWHRRLEHGYPVPTLDRDRLLAGLQPALERERVFSRGRFGGWKYEAGNQDHAFMQGVEWVDRVLSGRPERTYRLEGPLPG